MKLAVDRPLTPEEVEANRAERILHERLAGTYAELGRMSFQQLIAARDAGLSEQRVKNPYGTPATAAMLRGVGRNDLCPCGSGRKTKWCCA